jgi:amidohydrolase
MTTMKEKAYAIADKIRDYRRDFHMHPEIGFHEFRTARIIADSLEVMGYRVQRGVARTGVLGDMGEGSPMIAIRADIDALPIQEQNNVSYASTIPGMMHACGHDAHTAIALGVAHLLSKEEFPGTVRFLFQPSEDNGDEEDISGAPRMLEAGALDGVDAILGLHVLADSPSGKIFTVPGAFLPGADFFYASVLGKGGHTGSPHLTIDPIYISSHVVQAIYSIIPRSVPAYKRGVIALGTLHGGTKDGVIPEKVDLSGIYRYSDPDSREAIHSGLEKALAIAKSFGGDYSLDVHTAAPATINHPKMTEIVLQVAEDLFGKSQIGEYKPLTYGDDFAVFAEKVPACYFMVGAGIEDDPRRHHDPHFDIDETILPIGAAIMAESALRLLRGNLDFK